jgi:hypothetical protein
MKATDKTRIATSVDRCPHRGSPSQFSEILFAEQFRGQGHLVEGRGGESLSEELFHGIDELEPHVGVVLDCLSVGS